MLQIKQIFTLVFLVLCCSSVFALESSNDYASTEVSDSSVMLKVSDSIVYGSGYVSYDGSPWSAFSLSGDTPFSGWFLGSASADIAKQDAKTAYLAFYSCSQVSSSWDCHGNTWQVLAVDLSAVTSSRDVTVISASSDGIDVTVDFELSGFTNGDQGYHVHFTDGSELLEMYYEGSPAVLSGAADKVAEEKTLCAYVANPDHGQISDTQCVVVDEVQSGNGIRGDYFADTQFRQLVTSRIDESVDFDWGSSAPLDSMPADGFAIRWEAQVSAPESGSYEFIVESSDEVTLWIDNQVVLAQPGSVAVQLAAGLHALRLDYSDPSGSAMVKLLWRPPGGQTTVIPRSVFFGGQDLNNPPDVSLDVPAPDTEFSPGQTIQFVASASDLDGVAEVEFLVDGDVVGSDTSTPYAVDWSTSTNGQYKVSARAYDTRGSSSLTDPVSFSVGEEVIEVPSGTLRWSDPATWGGSLPEEGDEVFIAEDQKIILDVSPPPLAGVLVKGELHFAEADLELQSEYIIMNGPESLLQIGSEDDPFEHKAVITLLGTDDQKGNNIDNCGYKVVCARSGGKVELHGKVYGPTWTRLRDGSPAEPGDTSIVVDDASGWRVGDEIVIVSTDYDPGLAEQRTITSVSGNTVRFSEPLEFVHTAETQTWEGKVLDQRAEVLHLTRNIKIQGDENSENSGFGGHLILMNPFVGEQFGRWRGGSGEEFIDIWEDYTNPDDRKPHVSGVEFYRMGQQGVLARYPFHWHMYGDAEGSYLKDSSIHRTYQRCVTIHGTMNSLVENNVAFDAVGHCFFWEDGIETGNTVRNNVGALVRNYWDEDMRLIESDESPSVFWITNVDNIIEDNVAAGAYGFGFWFDMAEHPSGPSATEQVQLNAPQKFGTFSGNLAHSTALSFREKGGNEFPSFFHQLGSETETGTALFADGFQCIRNIECALGDFVAYRNDAMGFWSESRGVDLYNVLFADTPQGIRMTGDVRDITVIADTGVTGNPGKFGQGFAENDWYYKASGDAGKYHELEPSDLLEYESRAGRSLPITHEMLYGIDKLKFTALRLQYPDGDVYGADVIGYTDSDIIDAAVFMNPGNAESHGNRAHDVRLHNSEDIMGLDMSHNFGENAPRAFVVHDMVGTLEGDGSYVEYRYYDYRNSVNRWFVTVPGDAIESTLYGSGEFEDILRSDDCVDSGEDRVLKCTERAVRVTIHTDSDAENGRVRVTQESSGNQYDYSTPHIWVPGKDTYHFDLSQTPNPGSTSIRLVKAYPDDWVAYSFDYPGPVTVRQGQNNVEWVDSIDAFYSEDDRTSGIVMYYDQQEGRQYVKLWGNNRLRSNGRWDLNNIFVRFD